jgi:hypothetical protein
MSNSREEYEREFVQQAFGLASTNQKKKAKKAKGNTRVNLSERPKLSPEQILANNIKKLSEPRNRLNEGVAAKILNGLNGASKAQ